MANVTYLDFELKIAGQKGQYVVQVLRSPAGEARCEFKHSLSPVELENLVLKLTRVRSVTRKIDPPELAAARQLGTELFRAAFRDTVRDCLRSSLAATRSEGKGLRLKLRLQDAPELAVLPWEFLYDPDMGRFLAQSVDTPVIRYVELPESIPVFQTARPLRLLGIVASPRDFAGIDVQRERELLETALAPVIRSGQLEISWLEKPTLEELRIKLQNDNYHILHFVGHGGFHEQTQQGVLVFEDGSAHGTPAKAEIIGVLLHDHSSLRLAVLNACEGARNTTDDPFAGVATTLVRQGIPAVVAMQFVITDSAALAFAKEFYSAVATGFPVDSAVAEARKAVLTAPNEVEWGTPVLFLRTPNGVLFDFQIKVPGPQSNQTGESVHQEKSAAATPRSTAKENRTAEPERVGLDVRKASPFAPPDHDEAPTSAPPIGLVDDNRQQHLADLWRSALILFYSRDWTPAIRDFQAILELDPAYKDAAAKLATAKKEQRLAGFYAAALQARAAGRLQEAAGTLQQLVAEDIAYKDAATVLEDVRKTLLLAARYDDAQTLASVGKWHAVLEVFGEIAELDPKYPDPKQLRSAAQAGIAEQNRRKELEDLLSRALECIEVKNWQGAKLQLTRIQAIKRDYMGSAQLLLRTDEELASLQLKAKAAEVQATHNEGKTKNIACTSVTCAIVIKLGDYIGPVNSVAFSPDGKVIASGGNDNNVRLWDAATGAALHTKEGHSGWVNSVAFSPDGRVIASANGDSNVQLWNAATGVALSTLAGHNGSVYAVTFSPDGKVIASGNWDNTVQLWDGATGTALRTLKGHDRAVSSVAFSPDGKVLASGSWDNTVQLWDVATGAAVHTSLYGILCVSKIGSSSERNEQWPTHQDSARRR